MRPFTYFDDESQLMDPSYIRMLQEFNQRMEGFSEALNPNGPYGKGMMKSLGWEEKEPRESCA